MRKSKRIQINIVMLMILVYIFLNLTSCSDDQNKSIFDMLSTTSSNATTPVTMTEALMTTETTNMSETDVIVTTIQVTHEETTEVSDTVPIQEETAEVSDTAPIQEDTAEVSETVLQQEGTTVVSKSLQTEPEKLKAVDEFFAGKTEEILNRMSPVFTSIGFATLFENGFNLEPSIEYLETVLMWMIKLDAERSSVAEDGYGRMVTTQQMLDILNDVFLVKYEYVPQIDRDFFPYLHEKDSYFVQLGGPSIILKPITSEFLPETDTVELQFEIIAEYSQESEGILFIELIEDAGSSYGYSIVSSNLIPHDK